MAGQSQPIEGTTEMQLKDEHLLVSVMPEAFRGREGLARKTFDQPVVMATVETMPTPPPVLKPVVMTPRQTAQSPLKPPPPKRRVRVPVWLVVVGAVLLMGVAMGGWVLLGSLEEPEIAAPPVLSPPPVPVPVVPTTPVVIPIAPPEPTPPANPFGNGVYPGKDSDSDGLTDVEEKLFGSHELRPDTDGDAHIDGNEVHHLYDPTLPDPKRLVETGIVERVAPTDFGYTLLVVTAWDRVIRADGKQLLVRVPTGETFQMVLQPIAPTMTILEWYRSQTPVAQQVALDSTRTKQGFVSAWTKDQLTSYVRLSDDQLLIFTYQLGDHDRVEYRQTMEMMINSVERLSP